jgi:hypothetical protein
MVREDTIDGTKEEPGMPKTVHQRPPFPPFACCFEILGAAVFWGLEVFTARFNTYDETRHTTGRYLGLLRLLILLVALGFLDRRSSLSGPDLCGLVPLGEDRSHISTNDATLVLHRLSRPLLCSLFGDTLLVKTAVGDGP